MNLIKTIIDTGGNKPVLVFLHGFCESKQIWEQFTQPLRATYRLILIDLPGFGDNTEPQPEYTMESSAAYVREILAVLTIKKCVLVGHSLGGYVGLAFAEKYPEMLSGLVLFHSSALPDSADKKENRNKTIEFIKTNGVAIFMNTFVAPLFYEGNREKNQAAIQLLAQIGKKGIPAAITGTIAGMRDRPDRTEVLKNIPCPVLFIAGKQDPAVTLEQTLQQCYLPAISHTLFLDQTGHMGMFEQPDLTRKGIVGFVNSLNADI